MSEQLRVVACEAARAAGALIKDAFARTRGRAHNVEVKSGAIDLVTETDRASEQMLSDFFAEHFPTHGLYGEEGARRDAQGDDAPIWVIDPLDGTTNFAHGIPVFAVSIAAFVGGAPVAGAVFDPMRAEMFSASRGDGAWLNDERMHVSAVPSLDHAVACTGLPYDRRERPDFYLAYWSAVMVRTHGVRRPGAAAIDLAWVAAGRFDAFWEFGLAAWDVSAAALMIEEAGGTVTALDGGPADLFGARIAATNGHVHDELIAVLASVDPPAPGPPPIPPRPDGF